MKIKHLSHSGFMIEEGKNIFLFDVTDSLKLSNKDKNIYVFFSHSHQDHFSLENIKKLSKQKRVYFILSKEISQKTLLPALDCLFLLEPYKTIVIEGIEISTYGSTDLGNSYLVSSNGRKYFHSGDLNWWHWKKRMTPGQLKEEELAFKKEVDLLKGISIDFAFIPVDPRLEDSAFLAINYFLKTVHPKYVIPMHSFGQYTFYKNLSENIHLNNTILLNTKKQHQIIYEK